MLRNLPNYYIIRVLAIQELRTIDKIKITIDSLIVRLTMLQLRNYDNNQPTDDIAFQNLESEDTYQRRRYIDDIE